MELVTSLMRHILSSGSSFFLAVLCMIAVRKDCGLKRPGSQTEVGRAKSAIQQWSSPILSRRSACQADNPFREAYASLAQFEGTLKCKSLYDDVL